MSIHVPLKGMHHLRPSSGIITVSEKSKVYREERGKCLEEKEGGALPARRIRECFLELEMCFHEGRGYNYRPRKRVSNDMPAGNSAHRGRIGWCGA